MHEPSVGMLQVYHELNAKLVIAKGLKDLPLTRRHGPLLRAQLFGIFQISHEQRLSALLLGWDPEDFNFKQYAYAILYMASDGDSFSLVPELQLTQDESPFANLKRQAKDNEKLDFISHFGINAHLEGNDPGAVPD
ncbi:hypothetical protein OEA41_005908 [Lepraria neglecta]|uniref:Uncharacterized protein n=1 Tax=Lepraria neglecta TaxID=209136 RepID=A0AAE0DK11_9LECA|nr:hypothetical protein OEA41_005908 [Lepraria neglecta]